jgi:two-component system, NarL family, sensor histidine kinase UhpB
MTKQTTQSELAFIDLFSNSLTGLFILHRGLFRLVNHRFVEYTGYSEAELVGQSSLLIVVPEDRDMVRSAAVQMLRGERLEPYEYRIHHKDGSVHWQMETVTSIQYQGQRAVLGYCMDVTASKTAGKALSESAETTRALLNASIDQALLVDLEGNILASNAAGAARLGTKLEDLTGQNVYHLLPSAVARRRAERLAQVIRTGEPDRFDDETDDRVVQNSVYPVFDQQGQVIRLAIFSRDVTERKRADESIRRYQKQLRALTSQLSLAEERERRRIARELHDQIGQNLAMAKIRLGGISQSVPDIGLAQAMGDVNDLINEAIGFTRSLTFELSSPILYELGFQEAVEWYAEYTQQQSGVTIQVKHHGSTPVTDEEVSITLFKAVRELLHNVVKHARASQATVTLSGSADQITIQVEDNGIGLEVGPSSLGRGGHQGFGLFNVRERLEYLGGSFQIESAAGQFTRITLEAPLKRDTR